MVDEAVIASLNVTDEKTWINYQDAAKCCGYKELYQTGKECASAEAVDCRSILINLLSQYLMWTMISMLVITVVIVIITCAANARMKSDCRS